MAEKTGPIKLAWRSRAGRMVMWALVIATFILSVLVGSLVREEERKTRSVSLEKTAHMLASSVFSAGEEEGVILLKVADLLNVESVLGVEIRTGTDIPLNVGETDASFLNPQNTGAFQAQWSNDQSFVDIAIKPPGHYGVDWLVLRLDADSAMAPPIIGTLINWVAAPLLALLNGILSLWLVGRFFLTPLSGLQDYLKDNSGKYALSQVPQQLTSKNDDTGLLAKQIESMRQEVNEAKAKSDFQARFLHETPYPLIRCSVNRKVLYANVSARSENALFGDETKEFVSPALSELVRKAFYESKEVYGDIRTRDYTIIFRAIPVLDAGYVNLYGEHKQKPDEPI